MTTHAQLIAKAIASWLQVRESQREGLAQAAATQNKSLAATTAEIQAAMLPGTVIVRDGEVRITYEVGFGGTLSRPFAA